MKRILKAVIIIFSALMFGLIGLILFRKSKGKTLLPENLNDFKDDLGIKAETKSSAASQETGNQAQQEVPPSPQSLSEKGKTFTEQDNNKGKLIIAASAGIGAIIAKPVFGRVLVAGRAIATTTKTAITTAKIAKTAVSTTSKAATITGKTTAAVSKVAKALKPIATTTGKIAATISKVANPVLSLGKGAVSAVSKVAATAGVKAAASVVGKVAGKLFLPLTIGMAAYDTATLAQKKKEQGSLSVGDLVGQYSGLGGLGIGKKLPGFVQNIFGTKAI